MVGGRWERWRESGEMNGGRGLGRKGHYGGREGERERKREIKGEGEGGV